MAYKLRDRKQKRIYISSSSSEGEIDSGYTDPDYTRSMPRRQPQTHQNNTNLCNPNRATDIIEMVASSSTGRRRGRPPKKRVNGEEGKSYRRRKRTPYSLKKRAKFSNKTRKSQTKGTILSWLINLGIVEENAEVWYVDDSRSRIMLKGMITSAGILCGCCKKEITVWEFEVHAQSDLKTPYGNIFVAKKGVTLLECQLEAWNRDFESKKHGFNRIEPHENATDKNDDACMICADGGNLICCDHCPSTFHLSCMGLESIPQNDWLCPYCVCKYCGLADYDYDEILTCSQCEKRYHRACYLEEVLDLNGPETAVNSFCGQSCKEIFEYLERIIGVRNKLDGGLSWSLIRQTNLGSSAPTENLHQIVECNSKIAVVWGMMDSSFDTTIDRHTKVNVIQSIVYNRGSNLTRINFRGFYTAILEKDDEIISAASLRIHGTKIAEMPFVTTHENYRHRGMWRKLLVAIESALCFLNVENLIIPSIDELVTMWTERCGFTYIKDALMKELTFFNTLMFTKAVRLQKTLLITDAVKKPDGAETEAMEVDQVRNSCSQNGVDPENNQKKNQMVEINGMEVDKVDNNDNQMVRNGINPGEKLTNLLLFDLNLEPPEEGDQVLIMPMG